jgi:hypothetical protein
MAALPLRAEQAPCDVVGNGKLYISLHVQAWVVAAALAWLTICIARAVRSDQGVVNIPVRCICGRG